MILKNGKGLVPFSFHIQSMVDCEELLESYSPMEECINVDVLPSLCIVALLYFPMIESPNNHKKIESCTQSQKYTHLLVL